MILNLDTQFYPFGQQNEIQYEYKVFSGGEPHIRIQDFQPKNKSVQITDRIVDFNGIGKFLAAVNALQNMGAKKLDLFLPYFPGARQDRLMVDGEAFTAKVYADIFNAQQLENITIFDPHSDVSPALLNNCTVISNHTFINKVTQELPTSLYLVSPDGGALKKIYKLAEYLQDYDVIECSKSRDVKTGALSGFQVYCDDLQGRDCLVVDDICDGGGTFNGLAQELKKKNAGKLYLAVSHGIFSKGLDDLLENYDRIFTTDSFKNIEADRLTQIKFENGLLS